MMIVNTNDIVKKFDFGSVITEQDNRDACNIIKSIVDSGNYFTNSPKYQTKENLLGRPEAVWLKYRMSFLFSVFMYLGKEAQVMNMMSWSFMTNLESAEDRDKLWHHHWHPKRPDTDMLSGIFYLNIPDDVTNRDTCGTELAPQGPEHPGSYFVTPRDYAWTIYPSRIWHRPGIVQSNNYRYIIAVDIEYIR